MLYWLILAATLGQATQPAAETQPAASTQPAAQTQPAAVPDAVSSAQPAAPAPAVSPQASAATQPADVNGIDALTGSGVTVETTADGNIILTGDPNDLEILQQFIKEMDAQPVPTPQFELVKLKSAQAAGIAGQLKDFWDKVKAPAKGGLPAPEDRLTIIPEPRSNTLMIAASEQNMPEVLKIIEQLDQPSLAADVQFVAIPLEHIKPDEANQILQDLFQSRQQRLGATGKLFDIKPDLRTNSLLISAPEADLAVIKQIISLIDVPPTPEPGNVVKLAFFPLQKAVAIDLAKVLTEMLQANSDQAAAMKEQIRRMQMVVNAADGTQKELSPLNLEKPIKVFPEPGTNSIIIASVESNLTPIGELVRLLDSVPLADEMMVKIYPLVHADAETLRTSLADIFSQGRDLPEQPGKTVPGRIPPNIPGSALAYRIGLSADKRSNTIVVSGRPEQLLLVEQIIKAVDVQDDASKFPPRLVKLEHADVRRIAEAVQKLADQRQAMAEKLGPNAASREKILIIPDVRTNNLIVVAKDDNYEEIAKLAQQLDNVDPEYFGQIRIINLENLTATEIAGKIKELWEGRAKQKAEGGLPPDNPVIVTDSRSNSLVIASNREDFEMITHLVKELEQQQLSPMADIRPLIIKHNDVAKIADIVRKLFDERRKMSLGKGEEEQPSDRIAVVEDPFTKTLLIASSKGNYDEIVRLVSQLDVPPSAEGLLQVFYVKNADVTKSAEMLRELFDKGLWRGPVNAKELPESMTKVTIIPDFRSSALIVSASPENMAIVEDMLKKIDSVDTPHFQAEVRLFRIQNADVVNVADMLTQLFEGMKNTLKTEKEQLDVKIVPNIRSNTLMISGSRFAMKRAEELIPTLDQEAGLPTAEAKVYRLEQSSAARLGPVMTELFEKRASQEQKGKSTPITILADESSNSLIVTASKDDHTIFRDLLGKLDIKSSLSQQMEIIPLHDAKAEQLAATLTKLLEQQKTDGSPGYAITPEPRTNSLVVFAPADLMANIRSIVNRLDNVKITSEMALRVFNLRNAKADDLAKLLDEFFKAAGTGDGKDTRQMIIRFAPVDPATGRPLIDPDSGSELIRRLVHQDITITPDPNTNSLVVMSPEGSIDMMQMLIEMLDSVQPVTAEIQVFPLLNADATEMQKLLEDLFVNKGGSGTSSGRRTLIMSGAQVPPNIEGGGSAVDVSFAVDERTNSLIASGSPSYLKIVERLVVQLDYKEIEERVVRVVHLRNAKAEDVAETMGAYFDNESQLVQKAATGEAAPRQLQRQVTIQDGGKTSNTLLLSYSPRMESQIISMINELDQPPPQVMIQVLMAEVTLDDRFEMGMEFALQDLLFSEKATVGANGTLQGPGFDFVGGTDIGAAGSGGLAGLSFTVTGEDFNFLLRALQSEGRVEVLSRPSIMVRDNQEANITVGERVPTVQDITVSSAGVVTPSVTYEEVGIILSVTPIINPDGFVNLEISPEISAIGTSSVTVASGVSLPTFVQRKAETFVTVKDGETIIIGGLITSRENESESKVPIAGDIPFLGNAFRATVRTTTKTELLIVLTPHVIRDVTQARAVSVHMRDQTGLNENIRRSPLMQNLQVTPEEDQMGPIEPLRPRGEGSNSDPAEEQGPELDEFGPPISAIEVGPTQTSVVRSEAK